MSLLFSTGAIAGSVARGAPGMVLLKPTSIAHSGTSASIGANGQVTFTAVTSLSLNGVFSADFDNYVISCWDDVGTNSTVRARLRASGSDNSTASSYVWQRIIADGSSVTASRTTTDLWNISESGADLRNGFSASFYGPFLTQPTAFRTVMVEGRNNVQILDYAGTHNQSVSYDGISIIWSNSNTATGALQVYGVRS